jgi:predicted methyltransferase
VDPAGWTWNGTRYPHLEAAKDRTIYYWTGEAFAPVQRYAGSLVKLVPTRWGTPTFEIDGIKMLVSENVSSWEDARRKVALVEPRGKAVLDCCGGLGYFAAHCLEQGAREVRSYEKNPDVLWLRGFNPWSPATPVIHGDIAVEIARLPDASFDAALHDPPRFGIAGELYSLSFYQEIFRVLRKGARLFHYTGAPNKVSRGRDLPAEVIKRLKAAGFAAERSGDGVLARRT